MKATINELLSLKNALLSRRGELQATSRTCMRRTERKTKDYETEQPIVTIEESRFDPIDIEQRISEINFTIYKIDSSIKAKNAEVQIDLDIKEPEHLLSPIEPSPWKNTD